jgi:hypothetical protein
VKLRRTRQLCAALAPASSVPRPSFGRRVRKRLAPLVGHERSHASFAPQPPENTGPRNFQLGNPRRPHSRLLALATVNPRTHGVGSRSRTGTGRGGPASGFSPVPPHRRASFSAAPSFAPHRGFRRTAVLTTAYRHSAAPAAIPALPANRPNSPNLRISVNRTALRRFPIYRQIRRFPALAPNRPQPLIPCVSSKSAKTADSGLSAKAGL